MLTKKGMIGVIYDWGEPPGNQIRLIPFSHIAEAPYSAGGGVLHQDNLRISLDLSAIGQFEQIKAFRGRSFYFVDASSKTFRIFLLSSGNRADLVSIILLHYFLP